MHFIFHPFGKDVSILAHVPMHYSLLPSFQHTALPALCGLCPKGSGQSILQTVDSSTPVGYTVKHMRLIFYDMLSNNLLFMYIYFLLSTNCNICLFPPSHSIKILQYCLFSTNTTFAKITPHSFLQFQGSKTILMNFIWQGRQPRFPHMSTFTI